MVMEGSFSSHAKHVSTPAILAAADKRNRARMLISCPDHPGIVAAVSHFLYEHGANIVQSDQYTMDPGGGMFFIRIEFDLADMERELPELQEDFARVADGSDGLEYVPGEPQEADCDLCIQGRSCLLELLWQWRAGDLEAEIAMVISNHNDMRSLVESFGIPFHHIPVTAATKAEAEKRQLEVVADKADLIVLARYMQIVSPKFIEHYPNRIINIHHSFLPAFVGGKPYAQAYQRGVKIIGATAHYVTEELDGGPIIEQDVQRVSHRDNVEDLKRIGRTIERIVSCKSGEVACRGSYSCTSEQDSCI